MTEQEAIDIMCDLLDDISHHHTDCETLWSEEREEAFSIAESALEEIQQYRAIGTVEEVRRMQKYSSLAKKHGVIGKVIEVCAEYEEIGTVEECREAVEKQKAKKPLEYESHEDYDDGICPKCGAPVNSVFECCTDCGQKLDCSEDDVPDSR